jgi:signal transduction histidine kinase
MIARAGEKAGGRRRRLWSRPGVRLALLQVVIVVLAFGVVGLVARADIRAANERTLTREIQGEFGSLQDEIQRHGEPRLQRTVERRTQLWRGFEYGLEGAGGAAPAGRLADARGQAGWSVIHGRGAWGRARSFLVFSQATPGGGWLSVGKDLADVQHELQLVTWRLAAAAAGGALICLAVWALFAQETWRRLAGIADTAHLVAEGDLSVRAPLAPRRRADDIDDLGAAFNQMLDRIGGLIVQLRRVTTDVAHDLRTPLSRMRLKLEQLERSGELVSRDRLAIAGVHADLRELVRTFDALLQLAEIEGRNLAHDGIAFDVGEVASRVAEAFRPDLEAGGRALAVEVSPALVNGDPALIAQLVANLIENAMRHTPAGSSIRIDAGPCAEGAWLGVADDGAGIASHLRQAVLAPYFRLDESRSTPGSGLGLAIVAAIAARHQARLSLGDNGPGLRVTTVFPPADANAAAARPQVDDAPSRAAKHFAGIEINTRSRAPHRS